MTGVERKLFKIRAIPSTSADLVFGSEYDVNRSVFLIDGIWDDLTPNLIFRELFFLDIRHLILIYITADSLKNLCLSLQTFVQHRFS